MLGTIVRILIAIFSVYCLVDTVLSKKRELNLIWAIWKRFRFGVFFECLFVIILTVIAFILFIEYVPILKYGWLSIFYDGKAGNIMIKPIMEGSKSSFSLIRWLVPMFFSILLIILPILAKIEEEWFRKGKYSWKEIIINSIKFGFIHLIVGVPIFAGFVLSGVGFFFALKYKKAYKKTSKYLSHDEAEKEAVLTSTTYHTMYNSILILLMILLTTFEAIGYGNL